MRCARRLDAVRNTSRMAASCAATAAAGRLTLPASVLLTGAAERKRSGPASDRQRYCYQRRRRRAPYKGGANDYSPAKAEAFYAKRPLLVAERSRGSPKRPSPSTSSC